MGQGTDQGQLVRLGKAHVSFRKLHGVVTGAVVARVGTTTGHCLSATLGEKEYSFL